MAKLWDYNEDKSRIIIDTPKQRLRITGHRLSSVLGLNKWQSPFGAWAEITKLVKLPFEETKYTKFGKIVEPKLIKYVSERFPNVKSIEEYYGNIFKEYEYNNFKDLSDVFGGVIDAVSTRDDGKTIAMICECKTSSHPEQWANDNVPVDYLLQGALYSYMMGLDRVLFVCTFPQDIDYANPENYKVTDNNTKLVVKKLDDMLFEIDGRYLNIKDCMQYAQEWWDAHIESGISPKFDETIDKAYLDIIRSTDETKDNKLIDVCDKALNIAKEIDDLKKKYKITDLEKELKTLESSIKNKMIEKEMSMCGSYKLSKKVSNKFNEKMFADKEPTLYKAYCEETESYTLTKNKEKDEEK